MAIIKIVQEPQDFAFNTGVQNTTSPWTDTSRVPYGWTVQYAGITTTFPEPSGNDFWMHYRWGVSNINSNLDDFNVMRLFDADGTTIARFDIFNNDIRWNLFGDTTDTWTEDLVAGEAHTWDLHITKNGTTDLTMEIYKDAVLTDTLVVANTADTGLPVAHEGLITDASSSSSADRWYISEIVIADEDTTGWRVTQHSVNGFGDNTDWDGLVQSATDNSLVGGLSSDTLDDRSQFTLDYVDEMDDGHISTINRVVVQTYAQRGATGLASFNHFFQYEKDPSPDVITDGSDIALTTELDMYIDEYLVSPDTGVAWTPAEMVALQVGIRSRT